ncbi:MULTISPECIES: conjugal transfer protein TrbF [unclassified Pseudomonas]|jgi:Type IV secretory pathway, TrbF components|uniref:conjugal transfer protein TrbF n=1 Tax=unclassified Pseudomonas TaxID=196821 RepID=UPI000420726E|nr:MULTISPECIES: conjugal transfer protein TrbF [unclassified Pseudomonas]ATP47874.1 conjugal transfer protein TrbF [Pseudomonas putida]SME88739.1 type IV secretion system protein VirB5 [Pseudomonas sp. LAIL14HWK12:I11]SMR68101.1 type IV secretion system protein VirB5 [Pseudomonas sp. LAIL14HWK12:I10]SOD00332.1 type IV secretion system protein VirB5 [Pseudomonas sp. LAIL14HWK12:I8]GLO54280.1 conjugal transfer protein TrbF [Pseudomonas putida]
MSLADSIKGLVFKRPANATEKTEAPQGAVLDNPYLTARRTWNDHVGSLVTSRQSWQVVGILSMMVALAGVGGIIHIGSQSKFVPYVVEVDKLGQPMAVSPAQAAAPVDLRVMKSQVASFIADARTVTPDVALLRKSIFRLYALLGPNDPATQKMNEWLNGSKESSPFVRAAEETVSVDIRSVMQQTPETWQVDWEEVTRDRQGMLKGKATWRALVTTYTAEPTTQTSEEQVRMNPIGTYVRDFSWSKQL